MELDDIKLYKIIENHFRDGRTPAYQICKTINQKDNSITNEDIMHECYIHFYNKGLDGIKRYKKINTMQGLKVAIDNFSKKKYKLFFPKSNQDSLLDISRMFNLCKFTWEERKYTLIIMRLYRGYLTRESCGRTSELPFISMIENSKFYLKILLKSLDYLAISEINISDNIISQEDLNGIKLLREKFMNNKKISIADFPDKILSMKNKNQKKISHHKLLAFLKKNINIVILEILEKGHE